MPDQEFFEGFDRVSSGQPVVVFVLRGLSSAKNLETRLSCACRHKAFFLFFTAASKTRTTWKAQMSGTGCHRPRNERGGTGLFRLRLVFRFWMEIFPPAGGEG